ncbi:Gfo/Idh/MocA family protein [Parafrigoribacterium soli]|uniref:Gfo/Idh/MocA family protein n=1 Tax=Parafrigoribacterium soli TaxID=3144663 RepID=UPI0032EC6251
MTAIAIIGQGGMARAHARAWNDIGLGDRIRYVCAPGAPVPVADAPAATFVTDLATVLADPDVDIVSICTPTPTHADLAIRCLEAGRNVLLEKPIALTVEDALAIREAASRSSGMLMVAHVVRFFDGYRAIREQVEAGALGTVLSARAERLSATPGPSSWWHDESKSGGVVVDFAIHDFDQLNLFLGTPLTASARRVRADGPIEVRVDYEGGGVGQVVSFMGLPPEFPFASSIEVLGSRGLADHRFTGSPTGAVTPAGNDRYRLIVDGLANHRIESGNPYARQAQYFLDCVRDGVEPEFCPTDAAVLALAVALAARESLATGEPVTLVE